MPSPPRLHALMAVATVLVTPVPIWVDTAAVMEIVDAVDATTAAVVGTVAVVAEAATAILLATLLLSCRKGPGSASTPSP
jgi:hypothetical protein